MKKTSQTTEHESSPEDNKSFVEKRIYKKLTRKQVLFGGLIIFLMVLAGLIFFFRDYFSRPIPQEEITVSASPVPVAIGSFRVATGSATISYGLDVRVVTATAAQELFPKTQITTEENSVAEVILDETRLRFGPLTTAELGLSDKTIAIKKLLGSAYVKFEKIIGINEGLIIETPDTLAAVRGTRFAVFSDKEQTKIAVSEGAVSAAKSKPKELDEAVLIEANNTAVVDNEEEIIEGLSGFNLLSHEERTWLEFNERLNQATNQNEAIATESAQFLLDRVPKPTPTPLPSVTPQPSAPVVPVISQMLGEGYSNGTVQTEAGSYGLSCIGANKSSVRVITDSANESDCKNDCPVKPLHEYISSNGGFAGMNGMYFCPADYPACSDKKNSFDTLFFNYRVKRYINSDNNVYSVLPFLVVDNDSNPRFVGQTLEWGRDTNITAGIAGNPLLVHGGNMVATEAGLDDKQKTVKGNRGAFVQKGSMLYLCIVKGATVLDSARVYKALGVDNAMNIDGGGSSALWVNGGYKFGPGRALPNAIIFAPR